ncbi:DHA2 family efflux MFS transporter permease subunit [Pararhodospirillum photometricum]|uniref:Multidrug resistance protein B n=1 Tax=Pararhodospirillum photometricum DSM 122 TaxID=1150469 RepID=H6SL34_PARPM|nr:DHA2 family efflux MFS transporter permease subunit [Pararhodospirillum photometricum]CCG08699.1 Multidrug resistance protein B [Pararhodospirillum photometricum DSM 122]
MADAVLTAPTVSGGLLHGNRLVLAGVVLSLANFMVVLDMTIANVSVPHIAGSLGISMTQGTWVITSYAVAEAIIVPLTGWLAQRFGAVRIFVGAMVGFGVFSVLCGLSDSLTGLVVFRIGQGLCGGPIMPLSQTLMLRVFPKEKHASAMGLWAMTTVTAPVAGPILGGAISDNMSWPWIFFINVPVVIGCVLGAWELLRSSETPLRKQRIDRVGLLLMLIWVAALQIMLDTGREHNWFESPMIITLACVAVVGFLAFLIWEITETEPIVNLRVFRYRGFSASSATLSIAFGAFFATVVVIPQWLQTVQSYPATWAGYVLAAHGVLAVVCSPLAARLATKVDPRLLVSLGVGWLGVMALLRTQWTSDAGFFTFFLPQFLQGVGMPFFFVPLTVLSVRAVRPEETASAAGVMAFMRTLAGAIGASVAITAWADQTQSNREALVGALSDSERSLSLLQSVGLSAGQASVYLADMVEKQASTQAVIQVFAVTAGLFALGASLVWLAPRPKL